MQRDKHTQEIEATRIGGFGGSDAKLFYKIGLKGIESLSNTDKKRIRVAKGIDERKSISDTPAMAKGRAFEDWYAQRFEGFPPEYYSILAGLHQKALADAELLEKKEQKIMLLEDVPEEKIEEVE